MLPRVDFCDDKIKLNTESRLRIQISIGKPPYKYRTSPPYNYCSEAAIMSPKIRSILVKEIFH